jgi:methylated-DNA-[protein]-cysteine S-methyltransferase
MPQLNHVILGTVNTPAGLFGAVYTRKGLARLTFPDEPLSYCDEWVNRWEPGAVRLPAEGRLAELEGQLTAYFLGQLRRFSIPVDMRGTPFQQEVWRSLQGIEFGQIRSYGQVATQIGRPKAVRAVGAANGANPVPVIVPCHRVIGANGKLTGYAGGLPLKLQLLKIEGFVP